MQIQCMIAVSNGDLTHGNRQIYDFKKRIYHSDRTSWVKK